MGAQKGVSFKLLKGAPLYGILSFYGDMNFKKDLVFSRILIWNQNKPHSWVFSSFFLLHFGFSSFFGGGGARAFDLGRMGIPVMLNFTGGGGEQGKQETSEQASINTKTILVNLETALLKTSNAGYNTIE